MNLDDQHPNYKKLEKKHHDQSLIIYKKNEQCEEKEREIHLLEKRRNQYQRISQTKREKKKKYGENVCKRNKMILINYSFKHKK